MSTLKRKYNRKKQNFNGLKIVHTEDIFNKKEIKKGVKIFGRLKLGSPYVTKFNPKTKKETFLADPSQLPVTLKNKIIDEFSDTKKRKVVYLVEKSEANKK